ncbi:bifunctional N-acetylglucosamine-1-phosphate uridyltransferase/glucosamine-1-phosphate acetyltransferase [bacterium]|nr:bifunctional N-acetylglucosamine-1-phosphate uridyltransferase/glucosamine-1-phosphate acetyltransferase [bacterium]
MTLTNQKAVKAVILAAGKGTRMKSDKSKVLHEIFNKPLLGYVLDATEKSGIIDFSYVIVGHQAESVSEFCKKEYPRTTATRLQMPQLGTGHAISFVCEDLKDFDGEVVILCGDTPLIKAETLQEFINKHRENNSSLTVMSAIFDNPTNYGRIVRDANGLKAIVEEKDATPEQKQIKEINAGIYCVNWQEISPAFGELKNNNAQGEYYITDMVKWAVEKGLKTDSFILKNNNEIFGINSKTHLAEATKILNTETIQKHLDNGVQIVDPQTTWISPETEIGTDTLILPNVYITGKNKIGNNCKIGPFAHIRGNVEIDDYVKIGNFVELKKATIKSNTNVCHLSYVGDSEIGSGCNIGAGTITANYNPITKIKSKTIIKDGANTGSNSVIVAPVVMGENSNLAAGSVLTKNLDSNALGLTRAALRVIQNWVKNK